MLRAAGIAERQSCRPSDPRAARRRARTRHADTPTVAHLDRSAAVPGRRGQRPCDGTSYETRSRSTSRATTLVPRCAGPHGRAGRFDMLGQAARTDSVDAGERWMLPTCWRSDPRLGQPRPRRTLLRRAAAADPSLRERDGADETLVPAPSTARRTPKPGANLRGMFLRLDRYDGSAGPDRRALRSFDFKGNLLRSRRRLARGSASGRLVAARRRPRSRRGRGCGRPLEAETFTTEHRSTR